MEIIVIMIGTIVLSSVLDGINTIAICKDAADNGYKIHIKLLANYLTDMNKNGLKNILTKMFIPGINLYFSLDRAYKYLNDRDMTLYELKTADALTEMSKEEQYKYDNNPNVLGSLLININSNLIYDSNIKTVEVNDEFKSLISYAKDNNRILKVEGPASDLSDFDQLILLYDALNKIESLPISNNKKIDKLKELKEIEINNDNEKPKDYTLKKK